MPMAGLRAFYIPANGMAPTVLKGDRVLVDLRQYRDSNPKPYDIIVFRMDDLFVLKRVVAIGGDTVEGKDGVIVVNGNPLDEPYVQHVGYATPLELNQFGPVAVPRGKLFVTGDNRDFSKDSRMVEVGPVSENSVSGKALYTIRTSGWRSIAIDLR